MTTSHEVTIRPGPDTPEADPRPHTPADPARGLALRAAVELATRAPSVHNTQPWRWRIGDGRVELHADRDRRLYETDPDGRDLLISCGCALHHLDVALAGLGLATTVDRFPDPEDCDHLATVRVLDGPPDRTKAALCTAIVRRRTDRRPYRPDPVTAGALATLTAHARLPGVTLQPVRATARAHLDALLADAADTQRQRPGYASELMTWTHRFAGSFDGVHARSVPHDHPDLPDGRYRFPPGHLAGSHRFLPDGSTLVALVTDDDDELARLVAGEATSAVLLAATRSGLASAPLSQALELHETRLRLSRDVLHIPEHPQMIIRIGYPPDDVELPETPRRPLTSVLMPARTAASRT